MAVKQNNTDGSGEPNAAASDVNAGSGVVAGTNVATKGNVVIGVGLPSGGISQSNKNHTQNMEKVGASAKLTGGCGINIATSTTGPVTTAAAKASNIKSNENIGQGKDNAANAATAHVKKADKMDLTPILNIINWVDNKRSQMSENDILRIYQHIIMELARVQLPRQSPEDLKRFKEDISKVGVFFANTTDQQHYLFYLRIVCQLFTQSNANEQPPSCAIAVIFQLFNADMVLDAVQSLLELDYPDHNIRQTVRLLCDWMRMCNFCHNLNLWVFAILAGLERRQMFALVDEIALENIELLFVSLILPVLRPKVAPIVLHMLTTTQRPQVLHKIIAKFPRVISAMFQQSNTHDDNADDTKKWLKQLIDTTSKQMKRFKGYDALYEPVIDTIKNIRSSFDYKLHDLNDVDNEMMNDADECYTNANAKVGLVNLGNTCYMNSVLQALAMTKEFVREILLSQNASPLLIKMRQQIALMLYSQRYELTPSRVLNATRPPGFSPGLQQDSSEFLGYLLETLHEQEVGFGKSLATNQKIEPEQPILNASKEAETDKEKQEAQPSTVSTISHSTSSISKNNLLSTIDKTFSGKFATTYKCLTCGWKSCNIDSFRDMQLSFPEVKNDCASNYSVQDLIDYYCSPEKLDGDNQYNCERCKKLTDAERYINVISAPKNLILTLKHFKYDQKYHMRAKLMHKVFHDEKVSVKVCAVETLDEIYTVHYDLYAGVVHSGFSMDSGHYYTYAADATNRWYKFNDNIVTQSKSEELHNLTPPNTPYILFYQMSAHSGPERSPDNASALTINNSEIYEYDVPTTLALNDLPLEMREYVNHDNCLFAEELRVRRLKAANAKNAKARVSTSAGVGNYYNNNNNHYDDDDNDTPPPTGGGCGGNALNINVNRFVY